MRVDEQRGERSRRRAERAPGASLFQTRTVYNSKKAVSASQSGSANRVRQQPRDRAQRVAHEWLRFEPVRVGQRDPERGRKRREHRQSQREPDNSGLCRDRKDRADKHAPLAARQHDRRERNAELRLQREQAERHAGDVQGILVRAPANPARMPPG